MKLRVTPARVYKRATALLRTDPLSVKTGFTALVVSTGAGLVAGIVLGSITGTLLELPGLIVLVPAAVGLRGNVFGALASRLSTMAQLGDLRFSRKLSTSVGQNLASAAILSIFCSFSLAAIAKITSEAFGIENAISLLDFFAISIIGGLIPTFLVMIVTIFLAKACVRKQWDLDNVGAPIITATSDMVTIPSLVFATLIVKFDLVTIITASLASFFAIGIFVYGLLARHLIMNRIIKESLSILMLGGSISILAGLTVQGKIDSFSDFPILIVLIPPLLSINGAIGSILSARVSTKLHLGTIRADRFGFSNVSEDITISYLLSIPIFLILGIFCSIYSNVGHLQGPGWLLTIGISLIAGVIATTLSNFVGYLAAVMTYRFGFDPDNFAVPTVTSVSDLIGAVVLMLTIGVLQI